MLLTYVILIVGAYVLYRILFRKQRRVRKSRKEDRREARAQRGASRTIKTRGVVLGNVKMCPCGCGRTKGHCQEMTARAEHPEGMLGKRK